MDKMPTSLTNDLLFKEAFTHPDNRDKLIYFLSCFTNFKEEYLKKVNMRVIYESVFLKSKVKDKSLRGDVLIEFENTKINLECYSNFDGASFIKSLVYVMRIYSTSMERGNNNYDRLNHVIGINLIDNIDKNSIIKDKVYTEAGIIYEDLKLNDMINLELYRLDKVRESTYNEDKKKTKWLKFIGARNYEERKNIAKGDKRLEEMNEWVEEYINDEHTKKVFGEWAEHIALEKGKRMGEEQGVEKGIQIGKQKGIRIGKKEATVEIKQEIVLNMLKKDMDIKTIAELTNMAPKNIKQIADKLNKNLIETHI